MELIFTFGITFFVFTYFLQNFFKVPSYQLTIRYFMLEKNNKIPKLILKLAKIGNGKSVTWDDLSKEEGKRVGKYYEKLRDVSSMSLTFLYSQNLVHIQLTDKSYFFPLDKSQNYLVREEVGTVDEETNVEFILYRKPAGGWFKSPILVGYLKKDHKYGFPLGERGREVEIVFEFPESLVKKTFFTKGLEDRFKLTKDSDVLGGYKNDLGDEEPHSVFIAYDQRLNNCCHFNFLIHN